jgi:hypothetical protein
MMLFPTPYTDPFGWMNPHIARTHRGVPQDSPPAHCVVSRSPPAIVRDGDALRATLIKTFGFLPAIFERHVASFTNQVMTVRGAQRSSTPVVIDVRYRWSNEYYHFLTEALPNALLMHRECPGAAIACAVAPFTAELFRWFGIPGRILHAHRWGPRMRCAFVECGNPSPEKIAAIRDIVTAKMQFKKTLGILIRRDRTRRILNEPPLLEQLQARYPGLEWVVFDRLSTADTATLFSKAAVIAGPHGAGFANMLFSGPGTQIIEFMPLEQPNLCYWHLSEMLRNSYLMIPTTSDRTRSMVADFNAIDLLPACDAADG